MVVRGVFGIKGRTMRFDRCFARPLRDPCEFIAVATHARLFLGSTRAEFNATACIGRVFDPCFVSAVEITVPSRRVDAASRFTFVPKSNAALNARTCGVEWSGSANATGAKYQRIRVVILAAMTHRANLINNGRWIYGTAKMVINWKARVKSSRRELAVCQCVW